MILITVPHSYCCKTCGEHTCDYSAFRAAKALGKELSATIIVSDLNRTEMDYNRISSRSSVWRKNVLEKIKRSSIVLDVHSFPNDLSFGTIQGMIPEIVILDSYHFNGLFLDSYTSTDLVEYLERFGIIAKLLQGGENDINIQSREHGVTSVLLEFNEGLSDRRIAQIATIISSYFTKS